MELEEMAVDECVPNDRGKLAVIACKEEDSPLFAKP
jgi:hypothetical protein